jgi:hypothetical protein
VVFTRLLKKPKKGTIYDIVPKAKQQEAMQWLQANAFATTWLVNVSTLKNIDYAGQNASEICKPDI